MHHVYITDKLCHNALANLNIIRDVGMPDTSLTDYIQNDMALQHPDKCGFLQTT